MPDTKPTINTYVSDMLALERHMLQPLRHQIVDDDVKSCAPALRVVQRALDTIEAHESALKARLDALGGHAGEGVKSGVASAVGGIAAAIGNVRKTEVSKDLRDDYTALCLASASYTMLHTTALGLGDMTTADLAKRHLADYATLIMRANAALPMVVLGELQADGVRVEPGVADEAKQNSEDAWREGGARSHSSQN